MPIVVALAFLVTLRYCRPRSGEKILLIKALTLIHILITSPSLPRLPNCPAKARRRQSKSTSFTRERERKNNNSLNHANDHHCVCV